ncbi:hypothetical protein GF322_01440 [Candidatus Dependentiae bacterium]|nr:hypothetical protein [Candidatus Dependentiae bacterium]
MLKKNKGSILLFTLLILSLIAFLTQQLFRSIWVGVNFDKRVVATQKARALALGGFNLAISQLQERNAKEEEESRVGQKENPEKRFKNFLSRILPNLNKWQIFNLYKNIDGIDGQIKFCITCEDGKININKAFDFEKQEFKKEYAELLKGLYIKRKFAEGEILKKLTEFFKERKNELSDVTELIEIEGFENLNVFYQPPQLPEKGKLAQPNDSIYLQDLFTTWSFDDKIELLFASDSLCAILNLRRPVANDAQKLKDKYRILIENYKKNWGADWEKNWNYLQPIFGAKPKTLNVLNKILAKEFGTQSYSVLSCGIIEGVEQKVLAIIKVLDEKENKIEEIKQNKKKEAKDKDSEKKEKSNNKILKIVKMYWI